MHAYSYGAPGSKQKQAYSDIIVADQNQNFKNAPAQALWLSFLNLNYLDFGTPSEADQMIYCRDSAAPSKSILTREEAVERRRMRQQAAESNEEMPSLTDMGLSMPGTPKPAAVPFLASRSFL